MFPKAHVITSAAPVAAYAILSGMSLPEVVIWSALAAAVTVLIDFDHLLIQLLMPKRRRIILDIIRHPLRHSRVSVMRDRLHYSGFGILRMRVHLAETLAASAVFYLLSIPYAVPILMSLLIHCALDLYETVLDPDTR